MNHFFKKHSKNIATFLIVIAFIFCLNVVIATTRPSSYTTNIPTPIYSGSTGPGAQNQIKNAGLSVQKGFIAGNYASQFTFFDSFGKMVIKSTASSLASRSASTAPTLFVNGIIRLKNLAHSGTSNSLREVCVNDKGELVWCGQTTFTTPGIYFWKVPDGVSEVTFEVWGAGGAGWNDKNEPQQGTHHGSNSTVTGGGKTSGGGTYTVTVVGEGGKGANAKYVPGQGGSSSASGSVTTLTTVGGGNGGVGNQNNVSIQNCSGGYYSITGSDGTTGGSGGSSYGANASNGGSGASSAGNITCSPSGDWYVRGNYPSSVTTTPLIGVGGAGIGGKGGDSQYDTINTCADCFGDAGVAGGGGGGYKKVKVAVIPGNTFYITVGAGGSVVGSVYDVIYNPGGSQQAQHTYLTSGKGGDGAITIHY